MNTKATRRLFFALWPNDKTRNLIVKELKQFPKPINGQPIQPENLHITLHFIGSVNEDIQACMQKAAATVSAKGFICHLDRYGYFPRSKTLWLGSQDTPVGLTDLHTKLGEALTVCGYSAETRHFTPHISLIKKCTQAAQPEAGFSLDWVIDEFALLESKSDQHRLNYRLIETYPLTENY